MDTKNKATEGDQRLESYSDFLVEEDELETERLLTQLAELEPPKYNVVKEILISMVLFGLYYALFIYILDVPKDSPILILLMSVVVLFGVRNQPNLKADKRVTVLTELVFKLKAKQDAMRKQH